ncbi:type VI secretion system baseplate subunit TssE [Sorangium sp. So ce1000]|uniref:type VI secretion system baseplate subunit TssE n=1 Tax=Sorangium sp. So ce1000 TaxID=3133325 RepID=UPI003F60855B
MRDQNNRNVAPAPLFDRLVDLSFRSAEDPRASRVLRRDELIASVRSEVERIVNTRCPQPLAALEALAPGERSVIDYGLPRLGWLDPRSATDQKRLALLLERTIAAFEPRLTQVRVTVESPTPPERRLTAAVSARLVTGHIAEPVSFPIVVHAESDGEVMP